MYRDGLSPARDQSITRSNLHKRMAGNKIWGCGTEGPRGIIDRFGVDGDWGMDNGQ